MNTRIEQYVKMVIDTTGHFHNGKMKTHPCELYDWWGNETCEELDINSEIKKTRLPEGEYKITIIFEKVDV